MSKTLIIVESPTKAKTIGKFLGKDYVVVSSMGHIRDLPKSKLGIDPENNFAINYETPAKAKKTVSSLRKLAKEADEIILATDEDREGEAISWHLAQVLKLDPATAKRMVFHEITKKAILEALEHPRTINEHLVDAQQARRALDRIVGYKLSPFLWKKVQMGLSAGRVQSVSLRLIVEREREIEAFNAEEYWTVEGLFHAKDTSHPIPATLTHQAGKRLDKFAYTNQQDSDTLLELLRNREYQVASIEKKTQARHPYPPYITSTLQRDAAKRLYFSSKQTMMIAQQLYEGISIGSKGQTGLITYMRTDSTFLAGSALAAAKSEIDSRYGAKYSLDKPRMFVTKSKSAQEAHEAIRPTDPSLHPNEIKGYLDDKQFKLYSLIWSRFMATQMTAALFENTTVAIEDTQSQEYRFTARGKIQTFDGFMRVYDVSGDDTLLPQIEENESLQTEKIDGVQHFTQPPGRYSESSLIKVLEEHGIGRPSTYASIISTIQARKYVDKNDDRRFFPTDIGVIVNDMLVAHFPNIVDIDFTAKVEQQFDHVANGDETYQQMLTEFYDPFIANVKTKDKEVGKYQEIIPDRPCPECGHDLEYKRSRFGKFIACTNYPECKFTDKTEEEKKFDAEVGGEKCTECDTGVMQVKRGRFGPFLGCSNYPECKHLKKIEEKTGETCPKCNEGELVWKKAKKRGNKFKACNRFPDCDYIEGAKPKKYPTKKAGAKKPVTKKTSGKKTTTTKAKAVSKAKAETKAKPKAPAKKKTVAKKKAE